MANNEQARPQHGPSLHGPHSARPSLSMALSTALTVRTAALLRLDAATARERSVRYKPTT